MIPKTTEAFSLTGELISLTGDGSSGGEGTVFEVAGRPDLAAKIFHSDRARPELHRKLLAMVRSAPVDPTVATRNHHSIAWPKQILYQDSTRSQLLGFTMPRFDPAVFKESHTYYDPADRIRRFGGAYTWRHLFVAAHNLASAVAAVHEQGHRIGDLREANILVAPNSLLTLIDCDSFEIHSPSGEIFHTRVGSGEFLPPELQRADFSKNIDRYRSDLFALAVLMFKFLMLGVHPYQAISPGGPTSIEEKIAGGAFPYATGKDARPPDFAPPFHILQPAIRTLFIAAFVDGHRDDGARPSAADWLEALASCGPRLKSCRSNPHHIYGHHLWTCPWCRIASRLKRDPFPKMLSLGSQLLAIEPQGPRLADRREHLRALVSIALVDGEVSHQESEGLAVAAADLGLRRGELNGLIAEERRRARPTWGKTGNGASTLPSALVKQKRDAARLSNPIRGREAFSKSAGLFPFLLMLCALAWLAPFAVVAASIFLIAPSAATLGGRMAPKRRDLTRVLSMGMTAAQNVSLAVYHLLPALAWSLPPAVVLYAAVRIDLLDGLLAARVAGAAAAAWWWIYLLWVAGESEGYSFLIGLRRAARRGARLPLRRSPELIAAIVCVVVVALAILAAIKDALWLWPFG